MISRPLRRPWRSDGPKDALSVELNRSAIGSVSSFAVYLSQSLIVLTLDKGYSLSWIGCKTRQRDELAKSETLISVVVIRFH